MKVFLDSVGCRLNHAEIEGMAGRFQRAGHHILRAPEGADLIVVNTCTVTQAAAADSRARIRHHHRSNSEAEVIVTGCWSSLEPEAAAALPGVGLVVGNDKKDQLVAEVLQIKSQSIDLEPLARGAAPGLPLRTRGFIKAQDGCDHQCTFCLTTIARGASRSVPVSHVVERVQQATEAGVKEVVLSGVALSSYGRDLSERIDLCGLVHAILADTDVPRIRLSSLEPWGLPDNFLSLWSSERLCPHLHLPLQSGCAATLRRMGRPIRPEEFARLVDKAREHIPDLAVSTDLMVGFPGESESEFAKSLAFIESMAFSDAHLFTYSPREGTPAIKLPERVPHPVTKRRYQQLEASIGESRARFQRSFTGRTLQVLWESASSLGPAGWQLNGLTANALRVEAVAPKRLWNELTPVMMKGLAGRKLLGRTPKMSGGLAVGGAVIESGTRRP